MLRWWGEGEGGDGEGGEGEGGEGEGGEEVLQDNELIS